MSYSKEDSRAEIAQLVKDFQRVEGGLQKIPEAGIEKNYVRPLFRYLNWNVESAGLPVEQWEFLTQRRMGQRKRPDYILRLGGKDLLVMDAKAAEEDIHDLRYLNQVYAYAYSTQSNLESRKIDFAILTDFQEFVVLDCTLYASRREVIPSFRILDWRYPDYVEKFDELWELFERNNVLAASHEKKTGLWSRYLSPKQAKANRVPPDQAFLATLDEENSGWRVKIAKDMKKNNPELDGEIITAAVQLLINRLIFVKVLSDREVEEDYLAQLAEAVEQEGLADEDFSWFGACDKLFAKLNKTYNGSVFAPRPELEAVKVSNQAIREVVCDLKPENSPYNFAVLPVETLGTIYERFLGRVVRTTDHRVKIEDKPEVRKAGGVYYTPQYIVNYIVENTVGKLLADCQTPAQVAKLNILDPACGSGSFLLGAYDFLIEWHKRYYASKKISRKDREAAYSDDNGGIRLTVKLKQQILLNNIFGVDIDPQAVEVTRFSLSLKALEDIRHDELYQEWSLFHETILPNLFNNVRCGNNLVRPDYFDDKMIPNPGEVKRVNPFNWEVEFPQALQKGGFDCVIGNPPYIFGEYHDKNVKAYFHSKYQLAKNQYDTYALFIERALQMTADQGRFSFIIPDALLARDEAQGTRKMLLEEGLERIYHCGLVFQAGVSACVVTVHKGTQPSHLISEIRQGDQAILEHSSRAQRYLADSKNLLLIHASDAEAKIIDRLQKEGAPLIDLIKISRGEETGKKQVYDRGPIPILVGEDITRYHWNHPSHFIRKRAKSAELYKAPKIVIVKTGRRCIAALDTEGLVTMQSVYNVQVTRSTLDPKIILGILNSRLVRFFIEKTFTAYKLLFPQLNQTTIEAIPLPSKLKDQQTLVISEFDQMLEIQNQLFKAKTEHEKNSIQRQIEFADRQIDRLVYELYGLSEEDIKVVEEATK